VGNDTVIHVTIGLAVAALTGVFTAGCFYIYVQLMLKRLEERAIEHHQNLDKKIDKNFETHEKYIGEVEKEIQKDLAGIGGKVAEIARMMYRQHNNISTAIMYAADSDKEKEVAVLLKE